MSADAGPRARSRLLAPVCGFWSADAGACGSAQQVRPYVVGPRCRRHTPAALAGRPEPDELLRAAARAVPAVRPHPTT
ncbi:hypothetical protein [Actinomadura sp. 9N215]|uniref:hypothetical protein n=1 Tax=Actinomadura sp. 9N215 TaxID=3375150 RepID=UPI0037A89000